MKALGYVLAFVCSLSLPSAALAQAYGGKGACGPQIRMEKSLVVRGDYIYSMTGLRSPSPMPISGTYLVVPEKGSIWTAQEPIPISFVWTAAGLTQYAFDKAIPYNLLKKNPYYGSLFSYIESAITGQWDFNLVDFNVSCQKVGIDWMTTVEPKQGTPAVKLMKSLIIQGGRFTQSAVLIQPNGIRHTINLTNNSTSLLTPTKLERAYLNVQ